ncbi:MAG: nickel-dependent hydrogenase large subunit [Alphaproteobacteria bacterium]
MNGRTLRGTMVPHHLPWPRQVLDRFDQPDLAAFLGSGDTELLGLWGDAGAVHTALRDPASGALAVATMPCPTGRFPSIAAVRPGALRLERAVRDMFGHEPIGAVDSRPWLDHGLWPVTAPLAADPPAPVEPAAPQPAAVPYPFLPVEGDGLHQIPVGPVHAGIIEPGHFRFHASGETVVRLEQRLGYVHRGVESLLAGADLDRATRLVARVSGDSTVAYAYAFARAVEAATGTEPPRRAVWLRALMAELERLANHLGDIGAICNDAAFALMHAHTGILRERLLQAADAAFGHRLMMDRVVPGGTAVDLHADGIQAVRDAVAEVRKRFPALIRLYDRTASLQDRTVTTGFVRPDYATAYAAGGYVGRASGRAFDVRRDATYAPYDALAFEVPVRNDGDVNARVWIRIREVEQSLGLVDQILSALPGGPHRADIGPSSGEGVGLVEGFRGDVLVWLRIGGDHRIERCHPRDPSWFQWPLLEAAIADNIVADFPLCNKSFNCSYAGHDL